MSKKSTAKIDRKLDEAATRRSRELPPREQICTITSLLRESVILLNFVRIPRKLDTHYPEGVVSGAAHIGVVQGQIGLGRGTGPLLFKAELQIRLDAAVGRCADVDGAVVAGRFQTVVAVACPRRRMPRQARYRYLVVRRGGARQFDPAQAVTIETASGDPLWLQKELSEDSKESCCTAIPRGVRRKSAL